MFAEIAESSLLNVCVYATIHFYYAWYVCVCGCVGVRACACVYSFCTFQINYLLFFCLNLLAVSSLKSHDLCSLETDHESEATLHLKSHLLCIFSDCS